MRLFLITQPSLLRSRFGYTRQRLLGTWSGTRVVSTEPQRANSRLSTQLPENEEVWPTEKYPVLPSIPHTNLLPTQGSLTPIQAKTPK